MTRKNSTTMFNDLLLECLAKPDPMFHLLEWLCTQLMEAEVDSKLGTCKSERSDSRSGYRSGYRLLNFKGLVLTLPNIRSFLRFPPDFWLNTAVFLHIRF